MKKIAEKVAIVALICITFVFVLTAVLYVTDTINNYNVHEFYDENAQLLEMPNNSIIVIVMIVLAVVYALLALYLLYVNFAERENLRSVLLFCDSDSATRSGIKVINNIVRGCSTQVDGISVRKIRVRSDEKGGLSATFSVNVNADDVSGKINTLRCLLADSFKSTLNLTFNTINFQIDRLNGKYVPDAQQVEKRADTLQESQDTIVENYHEPLNKEAKAQKPQAEQPKEQTVSKEQTSNTPTAKQDTEQKVEASKPAEKKELEPVD